MPVTVNVASQVGEDLVHLVKVFSALRHQLPRLHPEVETSAYPLLFTLAAGPMRVSAIATQIHSDVSTVSRQVSHLVHAGLLEKVPDPDDGRAQNIGLAPDGRLLLEAIRDSRGRMFAAVMSDWSTEEVLAFDGFINRLRHGLADDFDACCMAASSGSADDNGGHLSNSTNRKQTT